MPGEVRLDSRGRANSGPVQTRAARGDRLHNEGQPKDRTQSTEAAQDGLTRGGGASSQNEPALVQKAAQQKSLSQQKAYQQKYAERVLSKIKKTKPQKDGKEFREN